MRAAAQVWLLLNVGAICRRQTHWPTAAAAPTLLLSSFFLPWRILFLCDGGEKESYSGFAANLLTHKKGKNERLIHVLLTLLYIVTLLYMLLFLSFQRRYTCIRWWHSQEHIAFKGGNGIIEFDKLFSLFKNSYLRSLGERVYRSQLEVRLKCRRCCTYDVFCNMNNNIWIFSIVIYDYIDQSWADAWILLWFYGCTSI